MVAKDGRRRTRKSSKRIKRTTQKIRRIKGGVGERGVGQPFDLYKNAYNEDASPTNNNPFLPVLGANNIIYWHRKNGTNMQKTIPYNTPGRIARVGNNGRVEEITAPPVDPKIKFAGLPRNTDTIDYLKGMLYIFETKAYSGYDKFPKNKLKVKKFIEYKNQFGLLNYNPPVEQVYNVRGELVDVVDTTEIVEYLNNVIAKKQRWELKRRRISPQCQKELSNAGVRWTTNA